ncbi:MAG: hypothetical protein ACJ75T_01075 [Solirubrobacterales bacterium]
MSPVQASRRRLAVCFSLALVTALLLVALGGSAPASAAVCPSFRVLHDDRIGQASFPAGTYELSTEPGTLSCQEASQLFARFLQDWDGDLPGTWEVVARKAGYAQFNNHGHPTINVRRTGGTGGGGNSEIGRLCPGSFTVNAGADVGPLLFAKGQYLLYIPSRSGISCNRASILFTRFLGAPGGALPDPWQVKTQTATFFKPAHPLRSAFRVEPANGV